MQVTKLLRPSNLCRFYKLSSNRWCHVRSRDKRASGMFAWQVTSFANGGKVELVSNVPVPIIRDPHHILVKVAYSSVNPLDVEMIRGFGHVLLKNMRTLATICKKNNEGTYDLPIILGRDFSGVVVAKGSAVTTLNIGDEVYGVIKPEFSGCHAEYALTYDSLTLKKPKHVSFAKASAVLYTSLTAWSALRISGHMIFGFSTDHPALIIGASGGVGQAAVQLLKAWGCGVVATCRTDAIPLVEKLSPNIIIDYTAPNHLSQLREACRGFAGKYFLVLDAAGLPDDELLKYRDIIDDNNGTIISLRSPLLSNIDQYGLFGGGVKSLTDLILTNLNYGSSFISLPKFRWAYFASPPSAMDEVKKLVDNGKLDPHIEKVYAFSDADKAYTRMKTGHLRGKVVISMTEGSSG